MARADGVFYWDVHGKRYLDAISGIYVVSVGHNNRRVIDAIKQAARRPDVFAADARHQPAGRATGQPAGRAGARRPVDGQVSVRRRRGRRGGDQAGAAVPQADRLAGQVQDHQPLPVVARLDAGRAVGLGPQVAQDGQRADGPGLHARLPADVLPMPVRQDLPRLRHHLRDDRRGRRSRWKTPRPWPPSWSSRSATPAA